MKRQKAKILAARHSVEPEMRLWQAVLNQAISDARRAYETKDGTGDKPLHKAKHWLTSHSTDFMMVCEMAGYDPRAIQDKMRRLFLCP